MNEEWKHASWVSPLGMIAWIIGIISGIISLIWGLLTAPLVFFGWGHPVWLIISGIGAILISIFIILPMFSIKCRDKDWDFLLNWVMPLGNFRFPWMLFWGIILSIFSWWGGLTVVIPALVLLFDGPQRYDWGTIK